ncbi:hypothetical protein ABTX24_16505 [Nocardioides sp. NPDC127514]|uniref:hypothetical protein n=1 Tax=unclassified Nocardioides TaxID=2615069 RepID=UPI003326C2FC
MTIDHGESLPPADMNDPRHNLHCRLGANWAYELGRGEWDLILSSNFRNVERDRRHLAALRALNVERRFIRQLINVERRLIRQQSRRTVLGSQLLTAFGRSPFSVVDPHAPRHPCLGRMGRFEQHVKSSSK